MRSSNILMKISSTSLILLVLSFGWTATAFSKNIGNIFKIVHPQFGYSLEYTDNVFREPSGEEDDLIQIISPGVAVNLPFAGDRHLFAVDYHVDIAYFKDHASENFQNHYVVASLDFDFVDYYLAISDKYLNTSDRAATEFTDRIDRDENTLTTKLGGEKNKISFEIVYDYFILDYDDSDFDDLDRKDNTFSGELGYQILPKTRALVEYKHRIIDYEEAGRRDGDFDQGVVGLEGQLFRKLVGTVKTGYQSRRYDKSSQDWSGAVMLGTIVGNLSATTNVRLNLERGARESVFADNNFYALTFISLFVNQKLFFEKLDGILGASFQNNDYDEAVRVKGRGINRNDDIYQVEAGINYKVLDYAITGVKYFYRRRDSNISDFDYTENKVIWNTAIRL